MIVDPAVPKFCSLISLDPLKNPSTRIEVPVPAEVPLALEVNVLPAPDQYAEPVKGSRATLSLLLLFNGYGSPIVDILSNQQP